MMDYTDKNNKNWPNDILNFFDISDFHTEAKNPECKTSICCNQAQSVKSDCRFRLWGCVFFYQLCVFRLGRWWRIKEAKNGLYVIPLKRRSKELTAEQQHNNTQ